MYNITLPFEKKNIVIKSLKTVEIQNGTKQWNSKSYWNVYQKNADLKFLGNNPPSTPLHPKNLPSSLQRKKRIFFVQRVGEVWEPPNAEKRENIQIQQRQRLHLVPKFTLKRAEFEAEDRDFFRVHWRHGFKRLLLGSVCRNRNYWNRF